MTVSDFILQRLAVWGVKRIFGYPGDGINGVMSALDRAGDRFEFVQVRHEETAAFMACGHAKFTGEVGVCVATSGPGAIHLLNGLYDAKLDHQPVLAIVGQQARAAMGGSYQQEVDLLSLYRDVASSFVQMATDPAQVRHLIDRAVRIALAERTVTCVILPNDVQELPAVEMPPHEHGTVHSSAGISRARIVPAEADLRRAADILNAGAKVAMLVGAGAAGAADEVIAVAERLGGGVAKALLGKAVLPDDLPFVTGSIGLLGTDASWKLMAECDTLLMVGTGFPYSEYLPKDGKARGIQIDIDGKMLGLRYPTELNLVGDSAETLRALLPLLADKKDRGWRKTIEQNIAAWWKKLEGRAMVAAKPVNPQRVFWELSPLLPDECILTCDSGSSASWYARDLRIRRGMKASLSGTLATMGCALPYALAAKFAFPGRTVIALAGDGAVQMLGLNELLTLAKYWKTWSDPRFILLVLNNRDLNMVSWEQRVLSGAPKFAGSQDLPDFSYAAYAEMLGLKGIRIDQPEQIAPAWREALAADRPVVIDAVTDPNVPSLPPHVTVKQATAFAKAIGQGDPDTRGVLVQTVKDAMQ